MDINYYKQYEPLWSSWHITRELGEGSYGKVFEIEHRDDFGTYKAALKTITIPKTISEVKSVMDNGMDVLSAKTYFRNIVMEIVKEFELMSKLKATNNVVSYEDHIVFEHKNGLGWDILIRMELLTALNDYVRTTMLTRRDVIQLGIDMCRALELCQKHRILHRDIKPENIFISKDGNYKLGDFGIARTLEKTTDMRTKIGTPSYMAPEVYNGKAYGTSVDIYSLGLVMYRLLNENRTPFLPPYPNPITHHDMEFALLKRTKGSDIPPPKYADGRLAEIVLKACAYSPKERHASPMQMRQELESILYKQSEAPVIYPQGDVAPINSVNYIDSDGDGKTSKTEKLLTDGNTQPDTEIELSTEFLGESCDENKPVIVSASLWKKRKFYLLAAGIIALALCVIPLFSRLNLSSEPTETPTLEPSPTPTPSPSPSPSPSKIMMPDLVNLTEDQALLIIDSKNLSFGNRTEAPSDKPAGTVIWQTPAAGDEVGEFDKVSFQVSTGPAAPTTGDVAPTPPRSGGGTQPNPNPSTPTQPPIVVMPPDQDAPPEIYIDF